MSLAPDDVAEQISKAIAIVAESPLITAKGPPVIVNISYPGEPLRKKTIVTRRDEQGNLVADVTEDARGR